MKLRQASAGPARYEAAMKDEPEPQGLKIIGRCGLRHPCLRLIADNVRSYEWETLPRREPRLARDRLRPLNAKGPHLRGPCKTLG
jgi:hypothetical protein